MKKFIRISGLILLFALLSVAMLPLLTACKDTSGEEASGEKVLYVLNWGDYIGEGVIKEFEEEFGVVVKYSMVDTNEMMITKVEKSDDRVDILCPSDYAIQRLLRNGKLQKLDREKLDNYDNLDTVLLNKIDDAFDKIAIKNGSEEEAEASIVDYMSPYMWGTLGVLYNTDKVSKEIAEKHGYGLLWNSPNIPQLNKKILMKDSVRDAMTAAALYLKEQKRLDGTKYANMSVFELINCTDSAYLEEIEKALKEQKAFLRKYEVDDGKGEMETGKAYVNLAWSGDAIAAMNDASPGVNLAYFIPESGGNVWLDGWVIAKKCTNTEAAHQFINFMARPEIAARNSAEIGYSSALTKEAFLGDAKAQEILLEGFAIEDLEEEFFGNEIIYPDLNNENLAIMQDFAENGEEILNMWERVKSKGDTAKILLIVFASLLGALAIIVGMILIFKNKSRKGKLLIEDSDLEEADELEEDIDMENDNHENENE